MRRSPISYVLMTIVLSFTSLTAAGEPVDETAMNAAIDETFRAWEAAIESGDVEALGDLVTEDAVFWTHGAPELEGREAVRSAFAQAFESWSMVQEFEEQERLLGDGWVFFRGVEHNTLHPRSGDGDPVTVHQRAFGIMKRGDDGTWRFARGMTNLAQER